MSLSQDIGKDVLDSDKDLAPETPPVDDYSHHSMTALEDRIKLEVE